jgi:hypothetical protein
MKNLTNCTELNQLILNNFQIKGTELGIYLKFLLHGIDQLEQAYQKNILLHTGEMLLPTHLLQHHPSIVEGRAYVNLIYVAVSNQLKEKIHAEFEVDLELETIDTEAVFTMTETQIQENIYFSDSECTSLLSIVDILDKCIEKLKNFNKDFSGILSYHKNSKINKQVIQLMGIELVKANILIRSRTFKIK